MALWTVLILLDSEWLTNDDTFIDGEPIGVASMCHAPKKSSSQLRLMYPAKYSLRADSTASCEAFLIHEANA